MRRIMNIVRALKVAPTEEAFYAVFDSYRVTRKEANIIAVILTVTSIFNK